MLDNHKEGVPFQRVCRYIMHEEFIISNEEHAAMRVIPQVIARCNLLVFHPAHRQHISH
jgi:hypothetical protein